ncbi:MAG TPA: hypothetical protein VKT78_12535, partial [Fimbriimonadaceae bacterium]|nr:hypothetical protein [Fimbriimonadaceae bacterium]
MLFLFPRLARSLAVGSVVGFACTGSAQFTPLHLWSGYGGNAQHTAQSIFPANALYPALANWSTPVD